MLTKPRWLLQLEGAAILWLALYFYYSSHFSWWLFALLFLTPDLSMLGYTNRCEMETNPLRAALWMATYPLATRYNIWITLRV